LCITWICSGVKTRGVDISGRHFSGGKTKRSR
jgi:hypothetical protein